MSNLKITVLCFDMSNNALGRAHILAKALQRYYDVEIAGPILGDGIWQPVRDDTSVSYKVLPRRSLRRALRMIDGDIILASKTKGTSFGYGLLKKLGSRKPLILDIDDWDFGLQLNGRLVQKLYDIALFWNTNNMTSTWLLEHLTRRADAITVSNTFLQRKFGGELIPHFRDTAQFDPAKYDQEKLKKKYGVAGKKVVLFMGTPRKHKGIMQLIDAVEALNDPSVTLLIAGASDADKADLPEKTFIKVYGYQPFDEIPKFLAAADLIVLFQSNAKAAQGQLPAKVFDAMSMAKPVIASRVSDLPIVLEGCGETVTPGDVGELVAKMRSMLGDLKAARKLGVKARQKCIEQYSYDAMAPKLRDIVESLNKH